MLSAERRRHLPWAENGAWRAAPPAKGLRSPRGSRLCELCCCRYLGDRVCEGNRECPRQWGMRRRQLSWFGGWWVPHHLADQWGSEDAEAAAQHQHTDELGRELGLGPAWAPPGAADFAATYKAAPTAAQFEAHRQLQLARLEQRSKTVPAPKPPPHIHLGAPCAQWSAAGDAATGHGYLAKPPPPKVPPGTSGTPIGAASSAGITVVDAVDLTAAGHGLLAKPPPPKAPRTTGTPIGAASSAGITVADAGGLSGGGACNPSPGPTPLAITDGSTDSLHRLHTSELIREMGLDRRRLSPPTRARLEAAVAAGVTAAQVLAADDAMDEAMDIVAPGDVITSHPEASLPGTLSGISNTRRAREGRAPAGS